MSQFKEIIGQEHIKEHFKKAILDQTLSHAYILNGERSSGKEFIAKTFAQAVQCENREQSSAEPCGECHSCKQAMSNNHPDIIVLNHEKPNTIGVDDIRLQINNDVAIKPYESDHKIYIIPDGEKMTVQAQNALLKTLEEPPAYVTIIILTDNAESFLPTILSRCVVLNMKPVSDDLVKKYLMEQIEVPDYKAEVCVAFARGNIGKAKLLAKSEDFENIKNEALILLKNIYDIELPDMVSAIKRISEYKWDINDYLDILSIWYRDVLLFKATHDANHLIFREEVQAIRKVADRSTYEGIENIIDALDKAKSRLNANVSFELTMELLLLTIQENV